MTHVPRRDFLAQLGSGIAGVGIAPHLLAARGLG
jgi:hypothetical protein